MSNERLAHMEVQWTTDPAIGWQQVNIEDWSLLADKGEPPLDRTPVYDAEHKRIIGFTGTEVTIDETEGWIYQICLHGITMSGDHIAVESFADHVKITVWNDDPGDPETLFPNAMVRRFYNDVVELVHHIDSQRTMRFKGLKHELDIYVPADQIARIERPLCTGGLANIYDYARLVIPPDSITRHGIWITNDLLDQHKIYKPSSWESWLG